jgi:hypothetical protein
MHLMFLPLNVTFLIREIQNVCRSKEEGHLA